jgi:hypothetical protein
MRNRTSADLFTLPPLLGKLTAASWGAVYRRTALITRRTGDSSRDRPIGAKRRAAVAFLLTGVRRWRAMTDFSRLPEM